MHEKAEFFLNNIYNIIDIVSHFIYVVSIAFRIVGLVWVSHHSLTTIVISAID
jgi:hypothetical protein